MISKMYKDISLSTRTANTIYTMFGRYDFQVLIRDSVIIHLLSKYKSDQ
jgi:hypothetical protein